MSAVKKVRTENEFYERIYDNRIDCTLVKFTAKWCGPCQIIGPYYEELARLYPHIQFLKVDVDELYEVASSANVRAMPTFVSYKHGHKTGEVAGINKDHILELVRKSC
jgi:thioredoxin 1